MAESGEGEAGRRGDADPTAGSADGAARGQAEGTVLMRAIRTAAGLAVIAVLVGVAVFFAEHPGRVAIAWQGWEVETSVGVLAAAALLLALAVAGLLRLSRLVGRSPRAVS